MFNSELICIDSIKNHILKLLEHISDLEVSLASKGVISWDDLIAKYFVYSLELNSLEALLLKRDIRAQLCSSLIEPQGIFQLDSVAVNWLSTLL